MFCFYKNVTQIMYWNERHQCFIFRHGTFVFFIIFKFFLNSNTPTTLSLQQLFLFYFFFYRKTLPHWYFGNHYIQFGQFSAKTFFLCKYFSNSRINKIFARKPRRKHGILTKHLHLKLVISSFRVYNRKVRLKHFTLDLISVQENCKQHHFLYTKLSTLF